MPNIMVRTKVVDEGSDSDSGDLQDVEADATDLMEGKKVYEKTCRLGASLVGKNVLKHYEDKGFFFRKVWPGLRVLTRLFRIPRKARLLFLGSTLMLGSDFPVMIGLR